jgi:hypothetical protein
MIFTGQENIDDVIFFPMMRPAVSPINSSIYGVQESTVAPVEDLVLSLEEFKSLCQDGALKPHARNLTVKPHVHCWSAPASPERWRASTQVEIEGFLPNSVLRLSGSSSPAVGRELGKEEEKHLLEQFEQALASFLKERFRECQVTVSPATISRHRLG